MARLVFWTLLATLAAVLLLVEGEATAAIGFEQQVDSLNRNLLSKMLPLVATCGLIYGGFLMATGNAEGKGKVMAVIGGSIIALLAPAFIDFLAGAL